MAETTAMDTTNTVLSPPMMDKGSISKNVSKQLDWMGTGNASTSIRSKVRKNHSIFVRPFQTY